MAVHLRDYVRWLGYQQIEAEKKMAAILRTAFLITFPIIKMR